MILIRHPSEYILVRRISTKQLYRFMGTDIPPKGFELVEADEYGQPTYKKDGRLQEKYWCLLRIRIQNGVVYQGSKPLGEEFYGY